MLDRGLRCIIAVWMCAAVAFSGGAAAHDLPLDRVMSAFVKTGPGQADLVVRVPLDLLRAVRFSLDRSGRYNLAETGPEVKTALDALANAILLWENDVQLVPEAAAGRLSELSDRSFAEFDTAVAHVAAPPDPDTIIAYELGYLDAHFTYKIRSAKSIFTIQTLVAADLKDTTKLGIRYLPLDESPRVMVITSEDGRVALDPAWYAASGGFIELGIEHILTGVDHILFLLCLVIPFRRLRPLIPVVTAFTLGHSATLIGTAFHLAPAGLWFPPFVDTAIAASIVYMALENIAGADLRRRWILAGVFGLLHGFAFSYALREQMQFAGAHLLVSLLSFNIGIEIGQVLVLCVCIPALSLLFRGAMAGRMGVILTSAVIAHIAGTWLSDRAGRFWQTPWPKWTTESAWKLATWGAGVALAIVAAMLLSKWIERRWSRLPHAAGRPAEVKSVPL